MKNILFSILVSALVGIGSILLATAFIALSYVLPLDLGYLWLTVYFLTLIILPIVAAVFIYLKFKASVNYRKIASLTAVLILFWAFVGFHLMLQYSTCKASKISLENFKSGRLVGNEKTMQIIASYEKNCFGFTYFGGAP